MNISTTLEDEKIEPDKPLGGYEWWYFDALTLDKKWGMVVIFYDGNPFSPSYIQSMDQIDGSKNTSPSDFPAISISLYKKGTTEYYSFLEYGEGLFHWDEEFNTGSVGSNFFKRTVEGDQLEYELLLSQVLESGHSMNAKLKFTSKKTESGIVNNGSKDEKHCWNLLQSKAIVSGSISIDGKKGEQSILFNGLGYHDHNVGFEPMKDSFKDWYWGRVHFADSTLIYYVMNGLNGDQQHEAWLIEDETENILDQFSNIKVSNPIKTWFGLESFRRIDLKLGTTQISILHKKVIDNGPFYQRFLSEATLNKSGDSIKAQGISEYIKPERIYEEKYWWLVKMRLRFKKEKAHWVQKSRIFYQWTW